MPRISKLNAEQKLERKRSIDRTYYRNLSPEQKRNRMKYGNVEKRKRRSLVRSEILVLLGNRCSRCGFSDKRALQIDHVHGNGKKEIRKFPNQDAYYRFVLEQLKAGSKDYQCLCANCNWIKRAENGEFRHPNEEPANNHDYQ